MLRRKVMAYVMNVALSEHSITYANALMTYFGTVSTIGQRCLKSSNTKVVALATTAVAICVGINPVISAIQFVGISGIILPIAHTYMITNTS